MKIGVCFKIVPDYEEIQPNEWENTNELDFTYVKKMYGCFDESALETALRLKDSCKSAGIEAEAVAVTAGVSSGSVSEGLLRGLFAAGFDDVVILPEADHFNPKSTSKLLTSWFKENPADIIFTGRMVGPNDSGTVPYYMAEELGYEIFAEVSSAQYCSEDGSVHVVCKEENLLKTYSITEKCICTVGDSDSPYLRLFPLKARMEAKKRNFIRWKEGEEVYGNGNMTMILRPEKRELSECIWIEDKKSEEVAGFLLNIIKGEAK